MIGTPLTVLLVHDSYIIDCTRVGELMTAMFTPLLHLDDVVEFPGAVEASLYLWLSIFFRIAIICFSMLKDVAS